ncbi:zinc finger protein 28-like [Condylostylus longicornis]|uniref:zinc finger protein 28-like n=1 Tax=Condylostylus longicornis TaxID=2530218 RepID=UPI00244E18FF|nr:zinc finger protein 28-like [Condylostylus longicornis]XP_055375091.1 zinc finger protein 28-like [Condylostylus longicornis]
MVNIIFSTCRICLHVKVIESEVWKNITEIDDYINNITIADKIQLLSEVKPDTTSELALLICPACATTLKIAYDFRVACRNSENIITNFIAQYKKQSLSEKILTCHYETNMKEFKFGQKEIAQRLDKEIKSNDNAVNKKSSSKTKADLNGKCKNKNVFEDDKDKPLGSYNLITENNSAYSDSDVESLRQSIINKSNLKTNIKPNEIKSKVYVRKYSKSNTKEKIFVCELCGNVYKKRALLTDHMRWHSGSKDFKCEICGKEFLLNTYLARHVRTHTGIRNYKCSFCSRTFYTNGLKRAHEKVHTGERCYKCELCTRTFSYSQSLQRHMLVHSGVKPHKCEDCGKEFRQESHLKQHKATNIHKYS